MSSNEIVIEVRNLGKSYNIYKRPQDRLKQSVIPRLQRLVGKPANRYFREFWALQNVSFEVQRGETPITATDQGNPHFFNLSVARSAHPPVP
jgi:lipopolysaccharide transport system ATP-binding protein